MSFIVPCPGGIVLTVGTRANIGTASPGSNPSFSGIAIGPADPARCVIWLISYNSTSAITAATIGGITATLIASATSGDLRTAIYAAMVPTGTTATFTLTCAAPSQFGSTCFPVIGLSSEAAFATASDATNPYSVNIDVPSGGVAAACCIEATGTARTITWSGVAAQGGGGFVGGNNWYTAFLGYEDGVSQQTISGAFSGSSPNAVFSFATWGP